MAWQGTRTALDRPRDADATASRTGERPRRKYSHEMTEAERDAAWVDEVTASPRQAVELTKRRASAQTEHYRAEARQEAQARDRTEKRPLSDPESRSKSRAGTGHRAKTSRRAPRRLTPAKAKRLARQGARTVTTPTGSAAGVLVGSLGLVALYIGLRNAPALSGIPKLIADAIEWLADPVAVIEYREGDTP